MVSPDVHDLVPGKQGKREEGGKKGKKKKKKARKEQKRERTAVSEKIRRKERKEGKKEGTREGRNSQYERKKEENYCDLFSSFASLSVGSLCVSF